MPRRCSTATLFFVGIIEAILFLLSYYFLIPDAIDVTESKTKNEEKNNIINGNVIGDNNGYWGNIDAEFNWCEYNYQHSHYIAEPWNVITSFFMCIFSICGYKYYSKYNYYIYDIVFCFYLIFIIGFGSMLFHASLRYSMQLLDELPMHYLGTYAVLLYYFRNSIANNKHTNSMFDLRKGIIKVEPAITTNKDKKSTNKNKNCDNCKQNNSDPAAVAVGGSSNLNALYLYICIVWNIFLTLLLFLTDKETSIYHNIGRGLWSFGFLGVLVYLYGSSLNASNEARMPEFGEKAVLWYYISAACWFTDNSFCHLLQNLPYNIPYLQLHAIGWHIGVTFAMYYWLFVLVIHRLVLKYKFENGKHFYCKTLLFGLIDYIVIDPNIVKMKQM